MRRKKLTLPVTEPEVIIPDAVISIGDRYFEVTKYGRDDLQLLADRTTNYQGINKGQD
jgi:hypothetical protein